jgi:hypothetical protein
LTWELARRRTPRHGSQTCKSACVWPSSAAQRFKPASSLSTAIRVTEEEVAAALSSFDPVWEALSPREQARIVQLLVERIDYDGGEGTIEIAFHPAGLKSLAAERGNTLVERRA